MFKVRFHLGRGQHFRHWQVCSRHGVEYFDPDLVRLTLLDCRLVNQRRLAERIWLGAPKGVCAWVQCRQFLVVPEDTYVGTEWVEREIQFNPRLRPYWCDMGQVADGREYPVLRTHGHRLVMAEEAHLGV
jgi:hypothetical protein